MRRQVSCLWKGMGETLVLHAFIFTLLHIRLKDKILNRVAAGIPKFNLILISSCKQFLYVRIVSKYLIHAVFFYWFNSYIYFPILSYILLLRHENVLHLISIYLQTSSFIGNQYDFYVFSYNVHVFKTPAQKKSPLHFLKPLCDL
jgi:hypothetical protein